ALECRIGEHQQVEASQVRTPQQAAPTRRQRTLNQIVARDRDMKSVEVARRHVDPVAQRGRDGAQMRKDGDPACGAVRGSAEKLVRCAPCGRIRDKEIQHDRIQQDPAQRTARGVGQPCDQADERSAAPLGPGGPPSLSKKPPDAGVVPGGAVGADECARWTLPLASVVSLPPRRVRTENTTWSPVASQATVTDSSGSRGAANLTFCKPVTGRFSAAARPVNTWSSSSAPGTMGYPGKCPGNAGCAAGIENRNSKVRDRTLMSYRRLPAAWPHAAVPQTAHPM